MDNDLKFRPYKWQDGLAIAENPNEKGLKGQPDLEKWLKLNEDEGVGYTAIYKGEIVGCGGVRFYWKGVGEAWALFPKYIGQAHIDPQVAKKLLYRMIEENNLQRVQATPRCDWPDGLRYCRYMGFKVEGKMRKYLPVNNGELVDVYMMSIVKEK